MKVGYLQKIVVKFLIQEKGTSPENIRDLSAKIGTGEETSSFDG